MIQRFAFLRKVNVPQFLKTGAKSLLRGGFYSSGATVRIPTMERRKGKMTGAQAAECTVTISRIDGVESSRTIAHISPRVPDGDYKLTVEGESSPSLWKGQERLDFARLNPLSC
jgi:hypothetical protein